MCFEIVHNDPSRSFKVVIDFGTNLKRVWGFPLVLNNLDPILLRFRDFIITVLYAESAMKLFSK